MPPRRPAGWIPRPALMALLSSRGPVVALVGPIGSGRSSMLAEWAAERDDVYWVEDGLVPEATCGVLVVDDAERLTPEVWAELDRRYLRHPDLMFRLATTTAAVVPRHWDVEVVEDLRLDREAVEAFLTRATSRGTPALVEFISGGHLDTVRRMARVDNPDSTRLRAAVLRDAEWLDQELAVLAVPENLTSELVAHLGGPDDFLARSERSGNGWWHGPVDARVFSLVPGLRAATRSHWRRSENENRSIHAAAAKLLLTHGAAFPALHESALAGDLTGVDAALKAGGMELLTSHGFGVMEVLRSFTISQLRRYPVVAMALALVLNARATHRLRALELFGAVVVGSRVGPVRPVDRLVLRTLESSALRVLGAGDGGVKAARAAVHLMTSIEPEELGTLRALGATMHVHLAISLLYGAAGDEAAEQFQLALSADPYTAAELLARGGIALVDALSGQIREARAEVTDSLAVGWPVEMLDEYSGSLLRMAEAQVAIDDHDFDAARRALDTIWPIIDTIEHWPLLAQQRAMVAIGTGEPALGLENFRSLRKRRTGRFGTSASVNAWLDQTEAVLLVAADRLVEARRVATASKSPSHLVLALVRLCAGEDTAALEHLARVSPQRPRERMTRAALEAVVLHRMGHQDRATRCATEVRSLAAVHGVRAPLLVLPADGHELFRDLLPGTGQASSVVVREVPQLSARELVVLREMVHTSQIASIARNLQVSTHTVKSQRRTLYRKLGATSRAEALAAALEHGILDG